MQSHVKINKFYDIITTRPKQMYTKFVVGFITLQVKFLFNIRIMDPEFNDQIKINRKWYKSQLRKKKKKRVKDLIDIYYNKL